MLHRTVIIAVVVVWVAACEGERAPGRTDATFPVEVTPNSSVGAQDASPSLEGGPVHTVPDENAPDASTPLQSAPEASRTPSTPLAAALTATRPPTRLPAPTPYYRLELERAADGTVHKRSVSTATLTQHPLPALAMEYIVVAYDGAKVVGAAPFRFPSEGHDSRHVNGRRSHESFSLSLATASVFIDASKALDKLEVRDAKSQVLLTVDAAELAARRPTPVVPSHVGVVRQALDDTLAATYPTIRFLSAGQEGELSASELKGRTLVTPDATANALVAEGLSRAAPLVLGSINRIGWAVWPKTTDQQVADAAETVAATVGATIFLNYEFRNSPLMLETVLHEAAHAFDFLTLAAVVTPAGLIAWPEPVRQAVLSVVKEYRLVAGFRALWSDLHASGFEDGHTAPYLGTANPGISDADARSAGAASAYGMTSAEEDIAEYVGTVDAGSGMFPGVCPVFDGMAAIIPAVAIPYAKLVLLLGAGAITEAGFDACVRGARIDAKQGFSFPNEGISFSDQVRGGLATSGGERFFRVLARGPNTYQIMVEVALDSAEATPLGLHRLDDIWLATINGAGQSGVYLAHDLPEKARAGASGIVLVSRSTTERQEGALFGLQLQNGFGQLTDHWSFGTFAAP